MIYLNKSAVKKLCKEYDRQASSDFLLSLDKYLEQIVIGACRTWNGGHKRLVPELLTKKKGIK